MTKNSNWDLDLRDGELGESKLADLLRMDTVDVFVDLGFKVWRQERMRLVGVDTAEKNTRVSAAQISKS